MNEKRVYYYYLRDKEKRPITTICLIQCEDGYWSRGISICSENGSPVKSIGRIKAYGRAKKAMIRKESSKSLHRLGEDFKYYSNWAVALTEREHAIAYPKKRTRKIH
jgi:hypothetical protein